MTSLPGFHAPKDILAVTAHHWCGGAIETAWVPGSANASPAWQGWILRMDEMVGWCCVNLKPALKDMQNGKWTKPTLEVSSTMFNLCVSTTKRMWIMSASVTPVIFMAEMVPRSQPFWLLWVVQIQGSPGVLHGLVQIENRSTDGAQ